LSTREPVQLPLFAHETVSVEWVAEYLRKSTQTVRRLLEDGEIKGYRLSPIGWWNVYKVSVFDYEAKLRRQYPPPGQK